MNLAHIIITISLLTLPAAAATWQPTDRQYQQAKARCAKYGDGIPLNYGAGDRGERDCEDLGYIIETMKGHGCHYNKFNWTCP